MTMTEPEQQICDDTATTAHFEWRCILEAGHEGPHWYKAVRYMPDPQP